MAKDKSIDVVSKTDLNEVRNAIDQAMREIKQRYDFKDSVSEISFDGSNREISILADDQLKLKNVIDVLTSKLVKRKVSLKALNYQNIESGAGDTVRQKIKIQDGIPTEKAKEILKLVKKTKLKVQASIQDDHVRLQGKSIDDLQEVMKMLREAPLDIDINFDNMR